MTAFDIATGQPWLITPEWLRTILEITTRENVITPEVIDKIDARREALAMRRGQMPPNARYTMRRGPIAIIDVTGPIVRYADIFSEISGGTATATLAMEFNSAISDQSVSAVILNIDSPGGEATGIHELAQAIFDARGKKPIYAYIGGVGASAAYWIASAADKIVIDKTAMLGSIGVVFTVPDPTNAKSARNIEIVSSQSPKKRLDPTTDTGRSELQRWADELATVFLDAVARNRGVTADQVAMNFGEGGLVIGTAAVAAKMADELGSLESLIAQLGRPRVAAGQINNRSTTGASMSETNMTAETQDIESVEAENPKILAMQARIDELEKIAAESKAEAEKALRSKLSSESDAMVDAWEREGVLSGNATDKVREVRKALVLGDKIATDAFDAMIAALPKFDTSRVAVAAKPAEPTLTADDFRKFDAGDGEAKAKVDAYVKALAAKDKTKSYVAHLKAVRAEALAAAK